jgi:hypothetical protein
MTDQVDQPETRPISPLRQRMLKDMAMHGLAGISTYTSGRALQAAQYIWERGGVGARAVWLGDTPHAPVDDART